MREWIVPVVAVALVAPFAIRQWARGVLAHRDGLYEACARVADEQYRKQDHGRF